MGELWIDRAREVCKDLEDGHIDDSERYWEAKDGDDPIRFTAESNLLEVDFTASAAGILAGVIAAGTALYGFIRYMGKYQTLATLFQSNSHSSKADTVQVPAANPVVHPHAINALYHADPLAGEARRLAVTYSR